jgi:hypothetical protein
MKGRENAGALVIEGYASLWGVADLNGDVVQAGAFAESLAKTGAEGVRMLHQHVGLSLTSTSPAPLRLAVLMLALRAYERGEAEMSVAPVEGWIAPYRVVRL